MFVTLRLVMVSPCLDTNIIFFVMFVNENFFNFSYKYDFCYAEVVVLFAVVILVLLFSMQHQGTDKVGWLFAPIVLLWFLLIGGIGMFNIWKYDSSILKAFSPLYVFRFFKKGGKDGWTSLGGIMLSITGKLSVRLLWQSAHFPFSDLYSLLKKKIN